MDMRLLNLLKLGLALTGIVLIGFSAVARADQGASSLGGPRQAIATAEGRAVSSATASPEVDGLEAESTTTAETPTNPPSGADAPGGGPPEAGPTSGDGEPPSGSQPDVGTAKEAPPGASSPAQAPDLPAAPQASTSGIGEAVREAILSASASPQGGSSGGAADTAAAESNATTQLIWQVQVSECAAHCSDIKQYQLAEQHNSTRQTLAGAPSNPTGQAAQAAAERAQATTSTTSIQLACIAYCYGTTTTTGTQIAGAVRQVVEALLAQLAAGLPGLRPTSAAEQATVEQISYQSQSGAAGTLVQVQSASQDSATVQSYDESAALTRGLDALLAGAPAASDEAVNQTEQGIWQLQIGCLMFCERTQQYQQAVQSNTTVQTNRSTSPAESTGASMANTATQLIWQAQIGCLFWCFDATEQQIATATNALVVVDEADETPAPSPAEPISQVGGSGTEPGASAGASPSPSPSPGTGPGSEPPTGLLGASGPSDAAVANPLSRPGPNSFAAAPPQAAAVAAAAAAGLRSTSSTRAALESRVGTRRSHMPSPRGTRSAPVGPVTGVRVALATVHAQSARTAARRSRAGDAARLAAAAPRATLGVGGSAAPSVPAGALLAAIALVGLCCLPIAVLFTRRRSRAGHADH
jgi:hypothetical protein